MLDKIKALQDHFVVRGDKYIMRVDFNVPLKDGQVSDDTRIRKSLPAIEYLLEREAIVILLSHLGRPKGKVKPEFSLRPVASHLSSLIQREVFFIPFTEDKEILRGYVKEALPRTVIMLENVRFYPGETQGDESLADMWASLSDFYVNEAFGVSHRKHTSVYHLPLKFPPDKRFAGPLLLKEIQAGRRLLEETSRPYVVITGGAKISDKVKLLKKLLNEADRVLIGGAMATCFLKAQGLNVGKSYYEQDAVEIAEQLLKEYESKISLPIDVVVLLPNNTTATVKVNEIPPEGAAMDVGPETIANWEPEILNAARIFWNGPVGVFEQEPFAKGTQSICSLLASAHQRGTFVLVGGGDTAAAANKFNITDKVSHVSTGGGAMLKFLEAGTLPGIEALYME
ncbi:MAG: phosphoglycerate kinase [Chlorobi bacterium]|nr:phosphoglycerate kinase [Chlorobiota bacterium]